jgi:hypothetical protein
VWGETTIAKGLNFNERGELIRAKWEAFDDPVAVGLDASRFDQHVSVDALEWEHSIYKECYPSQRKQLGALLNKQLFNSGVAYVDDHRISYSKRGGRMSGDMNTALGNCLIMTGLVWEYARQTNIKIKLINDGDDCVVFMDRKDLIGFQTPLKEWFRARGFSMKVEKPATELEAIEFCQCHPVWNGEQYTMCRNVSKALFTDGVHVGRTVDDIRDIRHATSVAGKVWAKGLPVFNGFYESLSTTPSLRKKHNFHGDFLHSGTMWLTKGCSSGTSHISNEARLSFERAFGISPTEQIAIEKFYIGLRKTQFSEPRIAQVYDSLIPPDQYPLFICESLSLIVLNGETS